jgi:hypothetical protein
MIKPGDARNTIHTKRSCQSHGVKSPLVEIIERPLRPMKTLNNEFSHTATKSDYIHAGNSGSLTASTPGPPHQARAWSRSPLYRPDSSAMSIREWSEINRRQVGRPMRPSLKCLKQKLSRHPQWNDFATPCQKRFNRCWQKRAHFLRGCGYWFTVSAGCLRFEVAG